MIIDEIINYITIIAPSIASLIGIVISVVKLVSSFKQKTDSLTTDFESFAEIIGDEIVELRKNNDRLAKALETQYQIDAELRKQNIEIKERLTGIKEQ